MNDIFKRELKSNIKLVIIWTLIIAALVLMMVGSFTVMKDDLEKLTEMMDVMTKALLAAFGMDNLNMIKIEGFYESKGHLIVILMGSIFAVYLSSSLLVKEEDDKTIEYLLSKPITRNEIYCAKYMAFVTIITMFNIVIAMLMAGGIYAFANAPVDGEIVTLLAVTPLILHLTFGTICFAISTLFKKVRLVIVLSLDMFDRIIQVSMVKGKSHLNLKWSQE
ncbi:ABC transporter permease subunit [Clostridium gasigenes]|uniref:ABC transporter permease subunit n=1 Tax=Clostridium gasigenes TaxID=94869 RepID=UPI00143832E0|nr:ABC transporter permease subunit [Clostridium gasigenes]NKF05394.1 ABC transporter permease subunit [Clostridium gasigenes]QSW18841.1 ABC transporter permease subunit [Clostridium gasigenes]